MGVAEESRAVLERSSSTCVKIRLAEPAKIRLQQDLHRRRLKCKFTVYSNSINIRIEGQHSQTAIRIPKTYENRIECGDHTAQVTGRRCEVGFGEAQDKLIQYEFNRDGFDGKLTDWSISGDAPAWMHAQQADKGTIL